MVGRRGVGGGGDTQRTENEQPAMQRVKRRFFFCFFSSESLKSENVGTTYWYVYFAYMVQRKRLATGPTVCGTYESYTGHRSLRTFSYLLNTDLLLSFRLEHVTLSCRVLYGLMPASHLDLLVSLL